MLLPLQGDEKVTEKSRNLVFCSVCCHVYSRFYLTKMSLLPVELV